MHLAGALDGDFEGRAHGRVELGEGSFEFGGRHANTVGTDAVELLAVVESGLGTAVANVVDDRDEP